MGKKDYAKKLYGDFKIIYNLESDDPKKIVSTGLITNLHLGVKSLLQKNICALEFFTPRMEILRDCVIIGDEISSGVIPLDKFSRKWRDETGRLYQFLASEADTVDRIFAGLALRLKG